MTTTTTKALAPTAETCFCDFKKDLALHDQLISFERMSPVTAAAVVSQLISNDDMGTGAKEPLFSDPDDLGRFVMQHNWQDPVSMAWLAGYVDFASNQAAMGRSRAG